MTHILVLTVWFASAGHPAAMHSITQEFADRPACLAAADDLARMMRASQGDLSSGTKESPTPVRIAADVKWRCLPKASGTKRGPAPSPRPSAL